MPESTLESEIDTIKKLLALKPNDLRIYPVYVIKPSKLYDMYKEGTYLPLDVKEAVKRVYHVLKECKKTNVRVIRIGLQSTSEITESNTSIAGPVCDNFAEYVLAQMVLDEIEKQINKYILPETKYIELVIPTRYTSIVVGPKKVNKNYIENKYNIKIKLKGEL